VQRSTSGVYPSFTGAAGARTSHCSGDVSLSASMLRTRPDWKTASQYIRIVRAPSGEAPLWVREKRIGLELPLAYGDRGPREAYTSGVLSGPGNRFFALLWRLLGRLPRQSGYAADADGALGVLEQAHPDAASWWRQNVPRLAGEKRKFLFQPSVCEIVNVASNAPHITT
jgi:hypothetical protein